MTTYITTFRVYSYSTVHLSPFFLFPPNQDGNFPTSSSEEFFSPSNFWAGVIRFGCFVLALVWNKKLKIILEKNHSYIRFANLYQLKSIFTIFSHFQGFPFVIRQAPKLFRHLTSSSFPSYALTPAWRINYSRVYIRQSHVCASVGPERPWKISPPPSFAADVRSINRCHRHICTTREVASERNIRREMRSNNETGIKTPFEYLLGKSLLASALTGKCCLEKQKEKS